MSDPPCVQDPTQIKLNKKAKKAKKDATKKASRSSAPKPPAEVKLSFSEQLGSDLANGLVQDPYSLKESLNLIDRVTFVKLPSPNITNPITDSTDASIEQELTVLSRIPSLLTKDGGSNDTSASSDVVQHHPKTKIREIFDLNDFTALASLQELIGRYGRVSHMGVLDPSYTFYITTDRTAALYYKAKNKIAVVGGDPLCPPSLFPKILAEFEKFRKKAGLGIAFMGAGETFVEYIRTQKWTTMCFATERVLNPMTNPVLHGNAGKSITRTSRNLLDPKKEGLTLKVYTPLLGKNSALQQQLVNVYEEWRDHRNDSKLPQAYITVYDPFAMPELMTYIYTKDRTGVPNGFAALRILGSNKGYHLDPYVASPGAPRGISELLLYGAMALLNTAKISYLSLGYEPLDDLGEIHGMPKSLKSISRKVHKMIFQGLHVAGKKDFHDKFHPDEAQSSKLYLVFPPGIPSLRHMQSVVHVANIKMRNAIFKGAKVKGEERKSAEANADAEREKQEGKPSGLLVASERLFSKSREKLHVSALVTPRKSQEV
ncbi:hypothetical protein LSUB1_G008717 [Lachnellula subtilissima]|uniref:Phosphatidylglycerol lysyltransferase C-terminal domain-containing protein n=1 Tax=Lachnellula subtilissima TaxID=602034 RepID=A0A8H8RB79_9HELO|nr:hypothetical protein LSUB1_G008717 [Lachnellula subtilissima]